MVLILVVDSIHNFVLVAGPREETIEDFWRMISENQLSTIVMVTRLIEGPKVSRQLALATRFLDMRSNFDHT